MILTKNQLKLKCHCNDDNCLENKTCETDGFCYQNLLVHIKDGRMIKKSIKGCSTSKQLDFLYVS